MGQEIERKFLVNKVLWAATPKPDGDPYHQGYLLTDPAKTIRVRVTGTAGYLTIKGKTTGATRAEYEYEIPRTEAIELLDQFAETVLEKVRYKVTVGGKVWEVDEFAGDNAGLILAEIELQDEQESFELPDWAETEVTSDARYYNSQLTLQPFATWG